jgi:purine-cytosine permease-like protein
MTSFGVLLVILGVGSFVLPYFNVDALDPYQPWAGVIVAALGLITVLFASRRREPAAAEASATAAAPAAPAAAAPAAAAPEPESKPWPTDAPERTDDD